MELLYKDSINYNEFVPLSLSTEIEDSKIKLNDNYHSINLSNPTAEDQINRWERMIYDRQSPLKEIQTQYQIAPIFPHSFLNSITQFLYINPKKTVKLLHYILDGPIENINYFNWKEIFDQLIIHLPNTIPLISHALSIDKSQSIRKIFLELRYLSNLYEFQNQPKFQNDLSFILKVLSPYKIISPTPKKPYPKSHSKIFLGTDSHYLNVYQFDQEIQDLGIEIDIKSKTEKQTNLDPDFVQEFQEETAFSHFCESLLNSNDYEVLENVFEAFLLMDPKNPDYDFVPYLIISNLERFEPIEAPNEPCEIIEIIENNDTDEVIFIGNEPKTGSKEPEINDPIIKNTVFHPVDTDETNRSQLDAINIYILTILGNRLDSRVMPHIPTLSSYIQQFLQTTDRSLISAFCLFVNNVIKHDNLDLLIDLGIAQKISFLISFDWNYKTKVTMMSILIDVVNSCDPTVFKQVVSEDLLISFIDYLNISDDNILRYILSILAKMIQFWNVLEPPPHYFEIIASGKDQFKDLAMSDHLVIRDTANIVLEFIEHFDNGISEFC